MLFGLLLGISGSARANDASSADLGADTSAGQAGLEEVLVVAVTPLPGPTVDREDVAASTRVLSASDINRTGIPSLTGAILANVPSVTVNDAEGNAFQPDILFRGFTASPVAGTPQGIAIFVNGERFNDAFGDTVNWDLIPPSAIQSATLEAANPVFGLNALGGSLSIRLKTGFDAPTANITAYGGNYGRAAGIAEFSQRYGDVGVYVVGDVTRDGGFRQTSESELYRLYADIGWRSEPGEVHLGITAVHDTLGNPGATPEQALNADISNIFTAPNIVDNNYFNLNLNGSVALAESTSVQGVAYFNTFNQIVPNGITEEVAPCGNGTGLLCNNDGTVVTGINGAPVTDFLNGATYSGLSVQQLNSHAYGGSIQVTETAPLANLVNRLVVGASFDGSRSIFAGVQEIGGFDPYSRQFLYPGVIQDQPSEGVNPVRVKSDTRFFGVFLNDTLTLAPPLDLTLSGRYNDAHISLSDLLGGPVNGDHTYARFNPSAGIVYRVDAALQFYANYSQTNRAPTPQELSCASAANPCSLLNFFVGDPNLDQVVARTIEGGLRGHLGDATRPLLSWNIDYYHTQDSNDIIYETTVYNPNLAFYTNAGRTLRRGIEANLRYDEERLHLTLGYSLTQASFETPLLLNSSSPAADANGNEQVLPGDRIPGIPRQRVNLVAEYSLGQRVGLGASVVTQSNSFRFGDEANLTQPIGGYTVVDFNASYRPNETVTLFAVLNNAFNKRYYTYGSFGPVGDVPWPNVPGGVGDPRTASPGTPASVYGGVKMNF